MSLNGLDAPDVVDAYQTAQADPAGWFLLRYANRDSVALLGRGKGGVAEARQAIAQYTEASPLYGLIMYRRRKILIKYIPEGTSRLLQARTTVHLQDILERYAPYETLLEIASPEDLNDTSLAASFPLHTASQSAASNRLGEISEDGEEGGGGGGIVAATVQPRQTAAQRYQERRAEQAMRAGWSTEKPALTAIQVPAANAALHGPRSPRSPLTSPVRASFLPSHATEDSMSQPAASTIGTPSSKSATDDAVSVMSSRDTESAANTTADTPRPMSPTKSIRSANTTVDKPRPMSPTKSIRSADSTNMLPADSLSGIRLAERPNTGEARNSSISSDVPEKRSSVETRDSSTSKLVLDPNDPYDIDKFFKPKVKLGPRPVADTEKTRRSLVPSIASVPASYRPLQKKQQQQQQQQAAQMQPPRTSPQDSLITRGLGSSHSQLTLNALPNPPPVPATPEYNPRPLSRGSIKSVPTHRSTTVTSDKTRLMKAVELRKRKLRQSNAPVEEFVPPADEEAPVVPKVPQSAEQDAVTLLQGAPPAISIQTADAPATQSDKTDSGIDMEADKAQGLPNGHSVEPLSSNLEQADSKEDSPVPVGILAAQPDVTDTVPVQTNTEPVHMEHVRHPADNVSKTQQHTSEVIPPENHEKPENLPENPEDMNGMIHASSTAVTDEEGTDKADMADPQELSQLTGELESLSNAADGPHGHEAEASAETTTTLPTIIVPELPPHANGDIGGQELDSAHHPEARDTEDDESSDGDILAVPEKHPRRQNSDLARRRRGIVEPLNIDSGTDISSEDDDEDVEIGTVTYGSAQSITVSKSPVMALLTRRPSTGSRASDAHSIRTVSAVQTPVTSQGDRLADVVDEPSSARPSSPWIPPRQQATVQPERPEAAAGVKRNVSSGISKRIQALAEQSSRESTPNGFDSSNRDLSTSIPSLHSRASSFKLQGRDSPVDGLMSTTNSPQPLNKPSVRHIPTDTVHRDSVSVSARIVRSRDERADSDSRPDSQFRQSHLIINHSRGTSQSTGSSITQPIQTLPPRSESRTSMASTSSAMRSPSDTPKPLTSTHGRQRPQPAATAVPEIPISPTWMANERVPTPTSPVASDQQSISKDSTRTSRFFKRMSQLGGKRKSNPTAPQSVASAASIMSADNATQSTIKAVNPMPPAIMLGNLNVQFPDTLLWKRRILSIDANGQLVFAVPQAMEHQKNVSRAFRLTDFRAPYIPDLDRQELANSVMLDFIDGSTTLQAACEDSASQRQLIATLKTYWRAWAAAP